MKANVSSFPAAGDLGPSFREHLQAERVRRCGDNPQYSLRAFALDLDIDHATLSQLIRGRRRMTEATIVRLAAKLRLADEAAAAFVRRERLLGPAADEDATLIELRKLSEYAAAAIVEWEHYAILELTRVRGFRPDVGWISRVLGISPDAVNVAVNRLVYLGMLKMVDERTWVDTSGPTVASVGDFGRAAVRTLHERVDALAAALPESARRLPQEHSSTTLAISTPLLAAAIQHQRVPARARDLAGE